VEQGLVERDAEIVSGIANWSVGVEVEQGEDLFDEGRGIPGEHSEGITGGIVETAAVEAEGEVACLLFGTGSGEEFVAEEGGSEGVLTMERGSGREGIRGGAVVHRVALSDRGTLAARDQRGNGNADADEEGF
jgi:hypothetical protein